MVRIDEIEYLDSQECFEKAIKEHRLSSTNGDWNYAGDFMYMGTWQGRDQFKNRNNRDYLK